MSSAYLRLLIISPWNLDPACHSSSPAFHTMYFACKLNKQGDKIRPWCTHFPLWNQSCSISSSDCCFLTCVQISQKVGKVVWYSHLFKNFPQFVVILTVKCFSSQWSRCFCGILLLFLWSSGWMLAIWSLVPLPFLKTVFTSSSSWFMYCWHMDCYFCVIVYSFYWKCIICK